MSESTLIRIGKHPPPIPGGSHLARPDTGRFRVKGLAGGSIFAHSLYDDSLRQIIEETGRASSSSLPGRFQEGA